MVSASPLLVWRRKILRKNRVSMSAVLLRMGQPVVKAASRRETKYYRYSMYCISVRRFLLSYNLSYGTVFILGMFFYPLYYKQLCFK